MKKILLGILPTILFLTILLEAFSVHALYQEVYVVAQPIPTTPHDTPPDLHFSILVEIHPWWNPIGHAFVQLNDSGTLYTIGFYPSSKLKGLLATKPGEVRNDSYSAWDWKITWDITVECWYLIATWVNPQISNPPYFQLYGEDNYYNCMKWAAAVAAQNGIIIPTYMYQNSKDIPDPSTFGNYLKGIGNGNRGYYGGMVGKNTASVSPSTDPIFIGSYMLASSTCLQNPSYFASYFNATLDAASMGSYTTTVGHPVSFASPVSVNLSETIVAWDFGDGSNDYQMLSTSHTYSSQGNYAVTFIAISENTVWSRTGTVTVSGGGGVGGIVVPVDKFGLLAPYIGLASTMMIGAVATAVYVKRVKHKKEKQ